jgi:ankyrin repeat protein
MLIEKGKAKYQITSQTGTPLVLAAESGNIELLKYLLSLPGSPTLNDSDLAGVTPLYVACYNHKLEMVNYLLKTSDCELM